MNSYRVAVDPTSAIAPHELVLSEKHSLRSGVTDFEEAFGEQPTSLEADLLRIASAVFAADRACKRGDREEFAREFHLSIPIVNTLRLLPLIRAIEEVLRFLSNDGWQIEFRQRSGAEEIQRDWPEGDGHTLLFSGGLDSLAAAVEFGSADHPIQLVSHRTSNTATSGTQRALADALQQRGLALKHHQFLISSRSDDEHELDHDVENTQRTRSFLFLVLGGIAARRSGQRKIVHLAENGQMAIHLPLDTSRIGAFSTHTAHPRVLTQMSHILVAALKVPLTIENPYLYRTKREVVLPIRKSHADLIDVASSCWKNARLAAGVTHCGICVPCQLRRIAIECDSPDTTAYGRNLWMEPIRSLDAFDDGRRNLMELMQFAVQFRDRTGEELMSEWPDLISSDFDAAKAIGMYRRFADEAFTVWSHYTEVSVLA